MYAKETLIRKTLTALLVGLLLISAAILIKGWLNGSFQSVDSLREYIGSFGIWGPLVLTLIQALQVVLPVLPGFLGCIVGAALFGTAAGFWINYIGICTGSLAAYALAKRYGIQLVQKMISLEKYDSFIRWLGCRRSYTWVLFFAVVLPLAPDDFLCYFSGLTAMPRRTFIWIILIGKPWCILFYCLFFSHFL